MGIPFRELKDGEGLPYCVDPALHGIPFRELKGEGIYGGFEHCDQGIPFRELKANEFIFNGLSR